MTFFWLSVLFLPLWTVLCQEPPAPVFYPCPFQGPAYPRPTNVANDAAVKAAIQNTTAVITGALQTGLIDNETTAFSLTAFSTTDKNSIPFYTFHQTPPLLSQAPLGVRKVTDQTVYRLGSLSKVFTVYTLLVVDGFKHFQDSITKFVPGLTKANNGHDPITSTNWDDITLQALASHMGGIGVECEQAE
jgi:CubicO group peptidase (beta-lactamase class C family)